MALFSFLRRRDPKDEFAKQVMARLKARGWSGGATYDRKRFEIRVGDGGVLYLSNTFADWTNYSRDQRQTALDAIVAPLFESHDIPDFDTAAPFLLPLMRNQCDIRAMARVDDDMPPLAWRPFAGPLCSILAVDRPASMALVNETTLADWGKSFEDAYEVALGNLESKSPCRFQRWDAGFYVSDFGDYCDASRLLLPRLFDQLDVKGAPVAVAVSRTTLIVSGSEEPDSLNAMAALVTQALEDDSRPISYAPLLLQDGVWCEFRPDDASLAPIRELTARQTLWDYAKQQRALEDERSGREVFIATANSATRDGEVQTWATWTKDVPTLLPRTDYIGITDLSLYLTRSWEDIEAVCGPFATEEGHYPVRFFVDRWPSDDQLARLKQEFSAPSWSPD